MCWNHWDKRITLGTMCVADENTLSHGLGMECSKLQHLWPHHAHQQHGSGPFTPHIVHLTHQCFPDGGDPGQHADPISFPAKPIDGWAEVPHPGLPHCPALLSAAACECLYCQAHWLLHHHSWPFSQPWWSCMASHCYCWTNCDM